MGLATSFFNDGNEDLSTDLVKILLETNQAVPDFLEHQKPAEGEELDFDDKSDDEGEADSGNAGGPVTGVKDAPADAWGTSTDEAPVVAAVAAAAPAADDGWGTAGGDDSGGAGW